MRLENLIIWGCKRLMLRDIDYIEFDFNEIQQIILGTNGAGKSTIMREAGPLPPVASDYTKKGGKIIRLEDRGSKYQLTTDFSKAPHPHSFIKDGVELNEGGTSTVQKELVRDHLRLTQELFDVLVGDTRFTAMPALKRRDWILKLSGSDLEYAMSVYKSLKTKHRDAQALTRHYAKRLAEESSGILSDEDLQETQIKIDTFKSDLEILYKNRINNISEFPLLQNKLSRLASDIIKLSDEALELDVTQPPWLKQAITEVHQLRPYLAGLEAELTQKEYRLKELYKNSNDLSQVIHALEANNNGDVEKLESTTEAMMLEYESLKGAVTDFVYPGSGGVAIRETYTLVHEELTEIFTAMPDNSTGKFSKVNAKANADAILETNVRIAKLKEHIQYHQLRIDHAQGVKHVNCPKCDHNWQPGVEVHQLAEAEREIALSVTEIAKLEESLKELQTFREQVVEYANYFARLQAIIQRSQRLAPLWDKFIEMDIYRRVPYSVTPTLVRFKEVADLWARFDELEIGIRNNQTLLDQVRKVQNSHGVVNAAQVTAINDQINALIGEIDLLKKRQNEYRLYVAKVEDILSRNTKMSQLKDEYKITIQNTIDAARNQCIDNDIAVRNAEIASLTRLVNDAKTSKALVQELETHKAQAENELRAWGLLVDQISPVDGLIAKYIKGFVDVFIEQMNTIINQIWTYDLRILSCGIEDTDVTCKFPLSVEGGSVITSDVSKASSAQVDIVDFIFRIVVMYYLELSDFPLYLDELAPTLDEKHRENILHFVDEFVTGKQCSQMFMISHYAAQHSIFENAQVCVIDEGNLLTLPTSYNHHVRFTRPAG